MKAIKGHRKRLLLLCPFFLAVGFVIAGYFIKAQVLEIGDGGLSFSVKPGEIFAHCFIHSMYDVPVCEKFRVEKGTFTLFYIETQSDAALEYYGIEKRQENNVNRRFTEMIIPAESSGRHRIQIGNREIHPDKSYTKDRHIRIRIIEIPVAAHIFHELWR